MFTQIVHFRPTAGGAASLLGAAQKVAIVEKKETATEGGILIASTSKSEMRPSTGKVVKVGPGRIAANGELMPMEVEEGDMVKFRDFAGNEVNIGGDEFSVVRMSDILAKF